MLNKDEVAGKAKKIKGSVKDRVGEITRDPDLEAEGEAEHLEGDIQDKTGRARRKIGEAVKDVGKKIARG